MHEFFQLAQNTKNITQVLDKYHPFPYLTKEIFKSKANDNFDEVNNKIASFKKE